MNILLVCLGNICRSPLAEGILRDKIEKAGLDISVDSAGTANYHVGEPPHKNTIRVAAENGLNINNLKARQFSVNDFDAFDIIYVMDSSNHADVISMSKDHKHQGKVRYFLNELKEGSNDNVPDPWFGGYDGFQEVYRLIDKTCDRIIERLKTEIDSK